MKGRFTSIATGLAMGALMLAGSGTAASAANDDTDLGRDLYMAHCAACHGQNGDGSGPVAGFMTVSPTDLTKISERNGGEFPFIEVFHVIDGRTETRGHGTSQMPVWGAAFSDPELGFDISGGPYGGEAIVRGRITALTFYVESIQQ